VSESNETEIPRSNAQAEKPDQTANEQDDKVEHADRQQEAVRSARRAWAAQDRQALRS
jgi:hypothetical protein